MQISRKDLYRIIMEEYIKEESETPDDDFQLGDLKSMIGNILSEAVDAYPGDAQAEYQSDVAGDSVRREEIAGQIDELSRALAGIEINLADVGGPESKEMRWRYGENLIGLFQEGSRHGDYIIDVANDIMEKMKKSTHELQVLVDILKNPEDYD